MIIDTYLRAYWARRPLVSLHPWEPHIALETRKSTLTLWNTDQWADEATQLLIALDVRISLQSRI